MEGSARLKGWFTAPVVVALASCATPGAKALAPGPDASRSGAGVPALATSSTPSASQPAWRTAPSLAALEDAAPPSADESPWEKVSLSVGGMLTGLNSDLRIGTTGVGVAVDLEEALGLDSTTTTLRVEGSWRFTENRRHRLDVSWVRLHRTADRVISEDIDIGDDTIIAGSEVDSEVDLQLVRAAYKYSLIHDERVDLAIGGGFYVAPISASVKATGVGGVDEDFSITAPLPVFGMRADVALTRRSYLRSQFELFYLEFDDYSGSLRNLGVAYEFRPWRYLGLGVGFESFAAGVEANGATQVPGVTGQGTIDFDYTGLILYLKGYF